jgi:hypothetical protein
MLCWIVVIGNFHSPPVPVPVPVIPSHLPLLKSVKYCFNLTVKRAIWCVFLVCSLCCATLFLFGGSTGRSNSRNMVFQCAITHLIFFIILCNVAVSLPPTSEKSPYHQHLPDCLNMPTFPRILKKTAVKGIVCPMIKDEIGFLSEWVAFYEMQGFNHVMFFDNNSTTSLSELDPWIKSGFVTIVHNWWAGEKNLFGNKKKKYNDMMRIKLLAEVQCKRKAVEWGYEIFVSLDLDEYLMPTRNTVTVMDELVTWFNSTTRGMAPLSKLQFPPVPHILEPINLLTIEAYQTRMLEPGKMNYYTSVSNKVALRLIGSPEYTNGTTEYLVNCCDFHGCGNFHFYPKCGELYKAGGNNV